MFEYIVLLFCHWVADFICQTDEQAQNKSSSNIALLRHCSSYFSVFFILSVLFLKQNTFNFVLFNAITHFVIDYLTSRGSKYFYKKGDIHNFFVVVGFDQFLHTAILLLTWGKL